MQLYISEQLYTIFQFNNFFPKIFYTIDVCGRMQITNFILNIKENSFVLYLQSDN